MVGRTDVPTRYVRVGDAEVAFKIAGEGDLDLLYCFGLGSNVDFFFDDPAVAGWISGLTSIGRLIVLDRRGTGASERVRPDVIPTWEDWADDVDAVLDAVGSERAVIFATLDAGPIGMLYAATRPERVRSLVLANTTARALVDDDYDIGVSKGAIDALVAAMRELWGTEELAALINPGMADDKLFIAENVRRLHAAATPSNAAAQYEYILRMDCRSWLSSIQAPTLVLHTSGNPIIPLTHGRYLADHIADAKFAEIPGSGIGWDDGATSQVLTELSDFLTGERRTFTLDRRLATVLFTDIVESTQYIVSRGDREWLDLLKSHDRIVREHLHRFGGIELDTTGDGFKGSFEDAARGVRCAQEITTAVRSLGIEVRAGLHTGQCEVQREDLLGLTVHVAARVGALAGPSEVLVTDDVRSLVEGSGLEFTLMGSHALKGLPGEWQLYALCD